MEIGQLAPDGDDDCDDDDPVLICEGVRVEIGQVVPEVVRLQSTTSVSGKPEKQQSYYSQEKIVKVQI